MATLDLAGSQAMPGPRASARVPARPGSILCLWIAAMVGLQSVLWVTGFKHRSLDDAVDRGAARAEQRRTGEVGDDLIRKAIRLQRETLPFWTTLARLADFAFEPAALAARAVAVATLFAAIAALTGRPIGFMAGLRAASWSQGFWVLSLAVTVGLMVGLRRADVETSPALFLPPGRYPAAIILLARGADPSLLWGWLAMAWGGFRRRQVNLPTALVVCLGLMMAETTVRVGCGLIAGAGMRLSILPG